MSSTPALILLVTHFSSALSLPMTLGFSPIHKRTVKLKHHHNSTSASVLPSVRQAAQQGWDCKHRVIGHGDGDDGKQNDQYRLPRLQ